MNKKSGNGRRKPKPKPKIEEAISEPPIRINDAELILLNTAVRCTEAWLRSQSGRNKVIKPEEVVKGFGTIRRGIIEEIYPLRVVENEERSPETD